MKEITDSEYEDYKQFKEYMDYSKWNDDYIKRHFKKVPESDIETWLLINKENSDSQDMLKYVEAGDIDSVKKLFESGHKISIIRPEDGQYISPAGYESKYAESLEKAVSLNNFDIVKYLFDNGVRTNNTDNLCISAQDAVRVYLQDSKNGPEFKIIINLIESDNINEIDKIINKKEKQPYCIRCDSDYSKRKSSNYYEYLKMSIEMNNFNLVKYFGNIYDTSYKYMIKYAKTQEMKDYLRNLYIEHLRNDIIHSVENNKDIECDFKNELRFFYDIKEWDLPFDLDKSEYFKLWSDGLSLAKSLKRTKIIDFLVKNGVVENKNYSYKKTDMEIMYDSIESNDLETIKKIFMKEPKITSKITYLRGGPGSEAKYSGVLVKAVETGKLDIVKYLYSNNVYTDHCSLLEKAVKNQHYEICKYLRSVGQELERYNDLNIRIDELIIAINNNDIDYIKHRLIKDGWLYNNDSKKLETFYVLRSYIDKMIERMLKDDKDFVINENGKELFDFFKETDQTKILKYFGEKK